MADSLLSLLKAQYPSSPDIEALESGDFLKVLHSDQVQSIFLGKGLSESAPNEWIERLGASVSSQAQNGCQGGTEGLTSQYLQIVSLTCLNAFLQLNVTGPPLSWSPSQCLLPAHLQTDETYKVLHHSLSAWLSVDGEAVYGRIPYVELLCVAKQLVNNMKDDEDATVRWTRLRVNSWHQRLLNEPSPSLHGSIKDDLDFLSFSFSSLDSNLTPEIKASFLLEQASISILHGDDQQARQNLAQASEESGFQYVLTGRLGKRTKFQTFDTSQLVVIAKSSETSNERKKKSESVISLEKRLEPDQINLNDETLLDKISFTPGSLLQNPVVEENIPAELQGIEPGDQPILKPLDSIILLSLASSITNTSPDNGLTREETLPYATRVLEGGSSNWQIYSQALLVRSRIEGFKSRTVERSVLQMQALVDQIIAETTAGNHLSDESNGDASTTTFLPRPKPSESASASERLQYIHSIASPTRWAIEAELAEKWVSIGGLKTALEIYERLEMWAEAALCWASLEEEGKARDIVVRQLYDDIEQEKEKELLPNNAPRLFSILGDLNDDISMYERSWEVSRHRYARAQRSLGKCYFRKRELQKADEAYSLSLEINPQNSSAWYMLGCIRLELKNWKGAVESFGRVVQREQDDAEAWSNLAASLLRLPVEEVALAETDADEEAVTSVAVPDPQKNAKQAFIAFKRASNLKREDHRIWRNVLNVAATLSPSPYSDIIIAQTRIIELRGSVEGEGCLDIEILEGLLNHVIQFSRENGVGSNGSAEEGEFASGSTKKVGLERMFLELMNKKVIPLITHSRRLWLLVAKLSVYLNKPSAALDAYEKAWRATLNKPGWDNESGLGGEVGAESNGNVDRDSKSPEAIWQDVVDSTIELADAYESLGEKEVTEGLKAGSGELVCKNWRQKSRMAIRSVTGRRSKAGLEGMDELQARMDMLKSA